MPGALMLAVGLVFTATALPTLSADCGCWRFVRLNTMDDTAVAPATRTEPEATATVMFGEPWAVTRQPVTVPVQAGKPLLGTWQSIVLVDLNADNPRRTVRLSFING